MSTKREQVIILWFLHYPNTGEGDIFQSSKKTFFLPTEHSEAMGLIALGSCRWWKLLWVQKVIRQTHRMKIWVNTETPLLAQEASELQFVRGQERTVGMCPLMLALSLSSSLNICYCLATVRRRPWTLLWAVKLSWSEWNHPTVRRQRPRRTEKGGCGSDKWLQGWTGPASSGWETNSFSGITHGHPPPLKYLYFVKSGLVQMALDFLRPKLHCVV